MLARLSRAVAPMSNAALLTGLSLASPIAFSQTLLDAVVVSGSKEGTVIRQTPAAITKIESLDEKKPVFVGQVLNQAPGVYVTDLGNEQHNMSIRQPLSYNSVYLYMEDGIPIRPAGLFNHNALYEINLEGIADIEVIKGPASSLYGSNAVGGAVNFFTRAAGRTPEAILGAQISDQGYRRVDYGAASRFGDNGLRLSGYSAQRRGGWQRYNDADKDGVTLRHDYVIGDDTTLKTVATYNRLDTDMPGSLNKTDYEQRPGFSYNTFTKREVEAARLSSALEGNWNTGGLTTITAYGRDNTTNQLPSYLIFNTGPSTASGRTTDQHFTSLGIDARHRQDFAAQTIRWINGITAERTPMRAREVNLAVQRDPVSQIYTSYTPTSVRRDYAVEVDNRAFYTQAEYAPISSVRFVVGGRYDDIRYDYTNRLTPSASTGAPSESRSYSHLSPKAGVTWNPSAQLNFYSNLSQGFTPPEVSAQYGGSLTTPNLREAVFDNIDAGVRWADNDRRTVADISIYRLTGKNEIINYSIAPGLSEPRNAGKTIHQGIEFGVGVKPATAWDAKVNGAFASHRYEQYQISATQAFNGNDIPAAPRWLVNAEVGYQSSQALRLSAETQYVGAYYLDDSNTVRYPGHVLLNLRANLKAGAWELWAHLLNATDRHYAEIAASSYKGIGVYNPDTQDTYSPGAPRTVLVGVRYRFGGR